MRYCSTRGGVRGWDFREVLFSGYAPDGGMFMPESLPTLSFDTLKSWTLLSYPEIVMEVCALFIPDNLISHPDLKDLLSHALSQFSVPGAVRLVQLREGLCVLELFHGQTLAFKDLSMTCATRFLEYFLCKESSQATVIVGTSGDTGGSAIYSARDLDGVDVMVLFPQRRITAVQEKHMTTCLEDNVHVFSVDGSSDDIDVVLRRLFADQDLVKRHRLMSLNSVNWARILVQIAHFLYAYLQLTDFQKVKGQELPTIEIVVPTGGAGNITAGCILKHMGVPIQLVAMVNANDVVHRVVQSGDFSMASSVKQTLASAIDIQDPYNMERIFWLLSQQNSMLVKEVMEDFQSSHRLLLPVDLHKKLSSIMSSGSVTDEQIIETMQRCWEENHYLLCPHSAVAVYYHYNSSPLQPGENRCCIATASPAKFKEAVQKAGLSPEVPVQMRALEEMETRCESLEKDTDWEAKLRERLEAVSSVRKHGGMFYTKIKVDAC